jgi:hypothetical protein
MIINKRRKIPMSVIMNDALVSRISSFHPKRTEIIVDTKKYMSGYKGERQLDYHLDLIKSQHYYNLQDIRLKLANNFFQIDSTVFSSSIIVNFEAKHWAGVLRYDNLNKEIIQIYDGEETRYPDPVFQAHRQALQFESWIKQHNFSCPPIEYFVVMTNPNVILDFDTKNEFTEKIIFPDYALEKLIQLPKIHLTQILTKKDINQISKLILEKHTPKEVNVLKRFGISPNEIIPGPRCIKCKQLSLIRKHRTWFCPTCQIHSPNAHEHDIIEYLLIHSSMTNQQCRIFLGLPPESMMLVSKLLTRMNLPYTGTTKNRVYFLPPEGNRYLEQYISNKYFSFKQF